ncbi:MAG: hypothetical protein ACLFRO_09080, partial [Desulfobacterales bacterium]
MKPGNATNFNPYPAHPVSPEQGRARVEAEESAAGDRPREVVVWAVEPVAGAPGRAARALEAAAKVRGPDRAVREKVEQVAN